MGSKPTNALTNVLMNYSIFSDEEISVLCDRVMKTAFNTVAKARQFFLSAIKK